MDANLLARAKLLVAAANQTSDNLKELEIFKNNSEQTSSIDIDSRVSPARNKKTVDNNCSVDETPKTCPDGSFRASVITGSTLVNTHDDIRAHVQKGEEILIDSLLCKTSATGTWSATCIELADDYKGNTNLEAYISIPESSEIPKFNVGKTRKAMVPVSSKSIVSAVQDLTSLKADYGAKKKKLTESSLQSTFRQKSSKKGQKKISSKDIHNNEQIIDSAVDISNLQDQQNDLLHKLRAIADSTSMVNGTDSIAGVHSSSPLLSPSIQKKHGIPSNQLSPNYSNSSNSQYTINFENGMTFDAATAAKNSEELARQRVIAKRQEDNRAKKRVQMEEEERREAARQASELKVKELNERTQMRVARYLASQRQKQLDKKLLKEKEEHRRIEQAAILNSQQQNQKLKALRAQSLKRLKDIERREQEQQIIREATMERRLAEIARKHDRATTFIPRLDAPSLRSTFEKKTEVPVTVRMEIGTMPNSRNNEDDADFRINTNKLVLPQLRSKSAQCALSSRHEFPNSSAATTSNNTTHKQDTAIEDPKIISNGNSHQSDDDEWSADSIDIPMITSHCQEEEHLMNQPHSMIDSLTSPRRKDEFVVRCEDDEASQLSDITVENDGVERRHLHRKQRNTNPAEEHNGNNKNSFRLPSLHNKPNPTVCTKNSFGKVSPKRKKQIWRKLKPIPVSIAYQAVHQPVS